MFIYRKAVLVELRKISLSRMRQKPVTENKHQKSSIHPGAEFLKF